MYNIDMSAKHHHVISRSVPFATIQNLITDIEIQTICQKLGHRWRERLLPPAITVRSMVYRSLHRNRSIKTLLTEIAASNSQFQTPTDAAWCQARNIRNIRDSHLLLLDILGLIIYINYFHPPVIFRYH
jgi:hypothetical protein